MGYLDGHKTFQAVMEAREMLARLREAGVRARAWLGLVASEGMIIYHVDTMPADRTTVELDALISRHARHGSAFQGAGWPWGVCSPDAAGWQTATQLQQYQRSLEKEWLVRYGATADFAAHCRAATELAVVALARISDLGFEAQVIGSLGTPWFGWDSDIDLYIDAPATPEQMLQIRLACSPLEGRARFDIIFASQIVTEEFRNWLRHGGRDAKELQRWAMQLESGFRRITNTSAE